MYSFNSFIDFLNDYYPQLVLSKKQHEDSSVYTLYNKDTQETILF